MGFSKVVTVPVRDGFFETPRRTPPPRESLHAVTMHVSAWFGRNERPPTSGVSPIHREHRIQVRGWGLRRPNHGLTTVVTTVVFTEESPNFSSRQVVVKSSGVASSWGGIGERKGRGSQRPIARFRRSRVAFASRVVIASGAPWVSRSITARASGVPTCSSAAMALKVRKTSGEVIVSAIVAT